jgi:hypothetical protein
VTVGELLGKKTISKVDGNSFQFEHDSLPNATGIGGGNTIMCTQNALADELIPMIQDFKPDGTTMTYNVNATRGVSLSLANDENQSISYSTPEGFEVVPFQNYILDAPRVIAGETIEEEEVTLLNGGNRLSLDMTVSLSTSSNWVSPVIFSDTMNMVARANIIDNQDSDADISYPFNNPISFVNEASKTGGTALSKHITRPIVLEEPAVGLKILLGANRPYTLRRFLSGRISPLMMFHGSWLPRMLSLRPIQTEMYSDSTNTQLVVWEETEILSLRLQLRL